MSDSTVGAHGYSRFVLQLFGVGGTIHSGWRRITAQSNFGVDE